MMVHFRKRIGPDLIKVCNQLTKANGIAMIQQLLASCGEGGSGVETGDFNAVEAELGVRPASDDPGSNWGTLMLDATCVPDDISYPVDLRLLNEARETTELMIDKIFSEMRGGITRKPRCNRDKARNLFLAFIKKKKPKKAEIREAKRFQLNEIRRNLLAIDKLIHCAAFTADHTVPIRGELSPPALQGGEPHIQQLGHLMGPCSGGHSGIEDLQGLAAIRRRGQSPSSSPQ
jgi:hypothetical protein